MFSLNRLSLDSFFKSKKPKETETIFETERGILVYTKSKILKVPKEFFKLKGYDATNIEIYCDIKILRVNNRDTAQWDFENLFDGGIKEVPNMHFSKNYRTALGDHPLPSYEMLPVYTREKMVLRDGWVIKEK